MRRKFLNINYTILRCENRMGKDYMPFMFYSIKGFDNKNIKSILIFFLSITIQKTEKNNNVLLSYSK